jgi:hypothetical protein
VICAACTFNSGSVSVVKITLFVQHCCGKKGTCRYAWQNISRPGEKMYVFNDVPTYTDTGHLLFGNIPVANDQSGDPTTAPAAAVVTKGDLDELLLLLPSRSSGYPAPAQLKVAETDPVAAPHYTGVPAQLKVQETVLFAASPYAGATQLPATFLAAANEAMAVAALGTMQNVDPPKDGKKKRSRPVAAPARPAAAPTHPAGTPVPPAVAPAPMRRSTRNTKNKPEGI